MIIKNKVVLASAFLVLAPIIVYACEVLYGVSFNAHVGEVTDGHDLADKVQARLGGRFGESAGVEGRVSYTVELPFGLQGGLHSIPVSKPCGKTFKEVLDEIYDDEPVAGSGGSESGGGGGGGGGGLGGGGYVGGSGCIYGCDPVVTVGELEKV